MRLSSAGADAHVIDFGTVAPAWFLFRLILWKVAKDNIHGDIIVVAVIVGVGHALLTFRHRSCR